MSQDTKRIIRKMKQLGEFIDSRKFQYAKSPDVIARLDKEADKRHYIIKTAVQMALHRKRLDLRLLTEELHELERLERIASTRKSDMLHYYASKANLW